jgi:hypothetical protein
MTTITQSHIDDLLNTLQSLHAQIAPLREQATALEKELNQVQQLYDQQLAPLNAEADQLELRKLSLRTRLAATEQEKESQPTVPVTAAYEVEPPPETLPVEDLPAPVALPPPPEDPRAIRKRRLADHIFYFLDNDQQIKMQTINALLADERCDVGDMLESLTWGAIWESRADWETLEAQHTRLLEWHESLEERCAYWQDKIRQMENSDMYTLWSQSHQAGQQDILVLLAHLVAQQQEENERLAHEVAVLEDAWQKKQARRKEHPHG